MQNREKQASYRARMNEKGMVQVLEWVPGCQRELFKAVAKALRDGQSVMIGDHHQDSVPSNQLGEHPDSVTSNHSPDHEKTAKRNGAAAYRERQARYAEQWLRATETLHIKDGNGKGHAARVLLRENKTLKGILGDETTFQRVTGLIQNGAKYQTFEYSIWPKVGIRVLKPPSWHVIPKEEIARARKRVSDLHPDKGGAGGPDYQAAKALLDALRG